MSGFGALRSGQSSKKPDAGRPKQSFEPPPQFGIPDDPISDAPIMRITVPVWRMASVTSLSVMQIPGRDIPAVRTSNQRREDTLQHARRDK